MNEEALLKKYRRTLLADPEKMPVRLDYQRRDIERIVPYRDPFLLIDGLTGLDRDEKTIVGVRRIPPDLPLFAGHFPDYPVYPGSLQMETIGQVGLCLYYFLGGNIDRIDEEPEPLQIRAVRVGGAYFRQPVEPGDTITIVARGLEHDGYFGTMIGQVIVKGAVATVALLEVAFLD